MPYEILTEQSVAAYLLQHESIRHRLNTADVNAVSVKEVGDGNLNLVFIVSHKEYALVVKQALPYLRCAGAGFPLAKERMHYETRAMQKFGEYAASHVPDIYHVDDEMCLVVMTYLNEHIILRKGLIEGVTYPNFADHLSTALANVLFHTSKFYLNPLDKAKLEEKFHDNGLRRLTENFVFTFPFMPHETNHIRPTLMGEAVVLWSDTAFTANVLQLKTLFMNKAEALIHGDLHTGSVMLNQHETFIIDYEFAFMGPIGFDLGTMLANLIMSWVSHFERSQNNILQEKILATIQKFIQQFDLKFKKLWSQTQSPDNSNDDLKDQTTYMCHLMEETVGFAGCEIARRQLGIAGVADIRDISDITGSATRAEKMALAIAKSLVVSHQQLNTIDAVIDILRDFARKFYPQSAPSVSQPVLNASIAGMFAGTGIGTNNGTGPSNQRAL